MLDHPWDGNSWALDARILRPLWWFGLLEYQGSRLEKRHSYRKSPLFNRFLSFDVVLVAAGGRRRAALTVTGRGKAAIVAHAPHRGRSVAGPDAARPVFAGRRDPRANTQRRDQAHADPHDPPNL